jgi:D-glycero-beta-D-manno-heptose-7-phosphate kinase
MTTMPIESNLTLFKGTIARFSSVRVLIVGDVMLDQYIIGHVRRVSPEAPVPVVEITKTTKILGGAANVAANIASLGGTPHMVGVVGVDSEAADMRAAFSSLDIATNGLVVAVDRPTSTKTRIVAGQQQICRIDHEQRTPVDANSENALIAEVDRNIDAADVCIVSDYDKGCLSHRVTRHLITSANRLGKPVVVDPKVRDFRKYAGGTVITPNTKEAEAASGEIIETKKDLDRVAKKLSAVMSDSALLITQGAKGMTLFRNGREPFHMAANTRRVFDVTGAGDTVVSTLALALAVDVDLEAAVLLANMAAGVVVQKPGTAQVSAGELLASASSGSRRKRSLSPAANSYAVFSEQYRSVST